MICEQSTDITVTATSSHFLEDSFPSPKLKSGCFKMRLIKIKPFLYTKLIEASRRKNKNRALVQDKSVLWIKKLKT
jgi:hypothetical protein